MGENVMEIEMNEDEQEKYQKAVLNTLETQEGDYNEWKLVVKTRIYLQDNLGETHTNPLKVRKIIENLVKDGKIIKKNIFGINSYRL